MAETDRPTYLEVRPAFLAFATDDAIQAALVHRTAAAEDSRLLPLSEVDRL